MSKLLLFLTFVIASFTYGQESISVSFFNDYKDVYHLSLVIYTPDGKIQTRVSNLNPEQIKSYLLPINTEIFIADSEQEAFAMKGNDIKLTGVKPFLVIKDSDNNKVISLSSIEQNKN